MREPNGSLKAVLEYFGLTNLAVSRATGIEPSSLSRIITGQRRLLAASPQMDALADFILAQSRHGKDMDWLKARFQEAGLPTDLSTVYRFRQNLIMWLATDGNRLRRNLGASFPGDIAGEAPPKPAQALRNAAHADGDVRIGILEILLALRPALAALPEDATIQLFLSNDRLTTATDEGFAGLINEMILARGLRVNLVICVSGDTQAMARLLDSYMAALISGHVRLSVVHGMTQTVTSALHILLPSVLCFLVNETVGLSAPPVALLLRDRAFVAETESNFSATARFAQPILTVYDDHYARNVLEILYLEFCTQGALDIVKDSLNPMYMTPQAYDRFLQTRGHPPQEFAWRSSEFVRFKGGMDAVLSAGAVYREILPLSRLNDIAQRGSCRMAGLYFMERGYVDLDTEGCLAILMGYIDYLEHIPNFHMLILDDLTLLHQNSCWHLKRNQSLGINNWQGQEPVMIHSDQLILLREFQRHFDALWARGEDAGSSRASVISILKDVVARLSAARSRKPNPRVRP
ncbi:MAG: hypothetical protein GX418_05240 [Clostridiales bacterium]|nr:hypothetical protein [Clostridiales bacterium]